MFEKTECKLCLGALICLALLGAPKSAVAQFNQWFTVDCSGNTPGAYTSINSVIPFLTDRSGIYLVPGTECNESISLIRLTNIWLGTDFGATATLNGQLNIQFSESIYLQSLTVHAPTGDGIAVNDSRAVVIDECSSSGNSGNGLGVFMGSTVTVDGYGTYDFNGGDGIYIAQNSTLILQAWGGPIDLSYNRGRGLGIDRSVFQTIGNTWIMNNGSEYGLDMEGRSTGLMVPIFGPNVVSNNPVVGIHVAEDSQLSIGGDPSWAPYLNIVQGNGSVGIADAYGGQLTLFGQTQIQDHPTAGIDVYGNSQLTFLSGFGSNQVTHNGFGTGPARAGIRLEGNSQGQIRGAGISQSGGPGILNLVNSSVDVGGSTFSSNAGGAIACDGSAVLVSDLPPSALGPANACRVGGQSSHNRDHFAFTIPDWKRQKASSDRMHAMVAKVKH
jgi:Right handed beta helix region